MSDDDGRAEAELFEGGLGVLDVGLTAVGGLRRLLALAVSALVEGDGAVPPESQRAVAAQWEARPIRPCSNSTPSDRPDTSGRPGAGSLPCPGTAFGGSANSQAASRTPPDPVTSMRRTIGPGTP